MFWWFYQIHSGQYSVKPARRCRSAVIVLREVCWKWCNVAPVRFCGASSTAPDSIKKNSLLTASRQPTVPRHGTQGSVASCAPRREAGLSWTQRSSCVPGGPHVFLVDLMCSWWTSCVPGGPHVFLVVLMCSWWTSVLTGRRETTGLIQLLKVTNVLVECGLCGGLNSRRCFKWFLQFLKSYWNIFLLWV